MADKEINTHKERVDELKEIKDLEWEKQNKNFFLNLLFLKNEKGDYKNKIGDYILLRKIELKEGFEKDKEDKTLVCIDERIAENGDITLAGSGILLSEEELKKFIEDNQIKIITTHDNCRAALAWAKRQDPNISQQKADELTKEYMQKIAQDCGIIHEHINIDEVEPKEYHNARMIYLNNVKGFNPRKIKKMLPGFVIENFVNIKDNAKKELTIAIDIAFGKHGFGERFTKDNPLIIACCLNKDDDFNNIKKEVEEILTEEYKKRIRIDFFIVPSIKYNKI